MPYKVVLIDGQEYHVQENEVSQLLRGVADESDDDDYGLQTANYYAEVKSSKIICLKVLKLKFFLKFRKLQLMIRMRRQLIILKVIWVN